MIIVLHKDTCLTEIRISPSLSGFGVYKRMSEFQLWLHQCWLHYKQRCFLFMPAKTQQFLLDNTTVANWFDRQAHMVWCEHCKSDPCVISKWSIFRTYLGITGCAQPRTARGWWLLNEHKVGSWRLYLLLPDTEVTSTLHSFSHLHPAGWAA